MTRRVLVVSGLPECGRVPGALGGAAGGLWVVDCGITPGLWVNFSRTSAILANMSISIVGIGVEATVGAAIVRNCVPESSLKTLLIIFQFRHFDPKKCQLPASLL